MVIVKEDVRLLWESIQRVHRRAVLLSAEVF
jgi:hypothetical protein